jgi:hypothetical protein
LTGVLMSMLDRAAAQSAVPDSPHGVAPLRDPLLNKGTAFSEEERDALGLFYTGALQAALAQERGQGPAKDISAIMSPIAHNLTQIQIAAVAAYVSYLK